MKDGQHLKAALHGPCDMTPCYFPDSDLSTTRFSGLLFFCHLGLLPLGTIYSEAQLCIRAFALCLRPPHFHLPPHTHTLHNLPLYLVWVSILLERPLPIILKKAPSTLHLFSLVSIVHNTFHYLSCFTYLSLFPFITCFPH